jgi:4-carboxymuconolactone decarboxylase
MSSIDATTNPSYLCGAVNIRAKRPVSRFTASLVAISLLVSACAPLERKATAKTDAGLPRAPTLDGVRAVSPALEHYTTGVLLGDLWRRPQLSPRDRSIVTLSVLIARNQVIELPYHLNLALDNGVSPSEISEIITHLAFYSGWANATGAVAVTKVVFEQRGVRPEQLPLANVDLLAIDAVSEAKRQASVQDSFGAVAPGVAQFTTDVLFRDLWLRPGLAPRDRSLVTVSSLIATGQIAQLAAHLNRAMDNGLTQPQASEALTQLAFYAGWPNVFSALPIVKDVFEKRRH